ncbi:garL [Symbiodinium natans]|uniref:GarL protein n=1 Tax=Symbiodinium natans TaxID=878477 RepID=A0A812N056_9DINO|nr:garL [Symbiodinium natans]
MTETAEQAVQFVAMARKSFPALSSMRGSGGPAAAAVRSAAPMASHFLRRRGEDLLMKAVQVETEAGLANVREIAKVEGLDMVFFAPVELAASAPRGQEAGLLLALETAEAEVKRAKKLLGGMLVPGRSAEMMFAAGYDLVCTTSDVILVRAAAENIVREAKPPATGPKGGLVRFVTSGREAKFARNDETLVTRLKKSRQARALGALVRLGSAAAAELVAASGFEVVVLDHSRGAEDLLGAVALVHAASRAGAHSLMRVPALSQAHLRRALQVGVEGIILPGVESAEEAHALVELCLYPSRNLRDDSHAAEARLKNQPFRRMDFSFAPPLVEFYGQRVAEFSRRQGEALLIAAQVDSPEGAAHIREIVKVEGIDMIFVDAMRLSGADVERIETAAKKHHRLLGGLLVPGCHVEDMYRAGYKLVCAASDHGLLAEGAKACLKAERPVE